MFNKNKKRKMIHIFFSGLIFLAIITFSIAMILTTISLNL